MVRPTLQKIAELAVQCRQQLGKAHTAVGEVEGEILRQSASSAQEGRAGVVEGVVGVRIAALPAVIAEGAVAADLLCRAVKEHGGVLRAQGGHLRVQAVVHRLKGGGGRGGLRAWRRGEAASRRGGQQQPHAGGGEGLAQKRQGAALPQEPRGQHGGGAEGACRQQPGVTAKAGGTAGTGAEHRRHVQRSAAAEIQHKTRQRTAADRLGHRLLRRERQQEQGGQRARRGEVQHRPRRQRAADAQQQQKEGAAARLAVGGAVRRQGRGADRQTVQKRQGDGAQRPLVHVARHEVGELGQRGGADGGSGAEAGLFIERRGAEGGVRAEDQDGGGGVAQSRLEVQKQQGTQTGAAAAHQPLPAHAGGSHRRQRPRGVLSPRCGGGQQQRHGAAAERPPREMRGGLSRRRQQVFHGLSLLFPAIVNGEGCGTCREMAKC